jgi:hypothetical protein
MAMAVRAWKTVVLVDIRVYSTSDELSKELAVGTFHLVSRNTHSRVLGASSSAPSSASDSPHCVTLETMFVVDEHDRSDFGEELEDALYRSMVNFVPYISSVRCLNIRYVRRPLPSSVLVRLEELLRICLDPSRDPGVQLLMSMLRRVNIVHIELGIDMDSISQAASGNANIVETLEELRRSEVLNTDEPWRTWIALLLADPACLMYLG